MWEWKDGIDLVANTQKVHVEKTKENNSKFETTAEARKLMHRFKEEQVEKLLDEAIMHPSS